MNAVEMFATNDLHSRQMISLLISEAPPDQLHFLGPAVLEDVYDKLGDDLFATLESLDLSDDARSVVRKSIARESAKYPYPRENLP